MVLSQAGARRRVLSLVATVAVLSGCAVAGATPDQPAGVDSRTLEDPGVPATALIPDRPNVVFILTDDLSSNLVPHMAEVTALARDGVSFDNFIVSDPQCCPSRATILTGKYPHNTEVESNDWPTGGFGMFTKHNEEASLGPYLQAAGYRTGLMGKYLNGYEPEGRVATKPKLAPPYIEGYVPPGWDEWHVPGRQGYRHFGYSMATAVDEPVATVEQFGDVEEDYLTDVLATRAEEFIDRAAPGVDGSDAQPFFLEISTFAPHSGGRKLPVPGESAVSIAPRDQALAPRDAADWPRQWADPTFPGGDCGDPDGGGCAQITYPEPTDEHGRLSFGVVPEDAPDWQTGRGLDEGLDRMRARYVERVQMVQSLDDLVGRVRAKLVEAGLDDTTYLVFSSDNGFHIGEHGLKSGKTTAYDHDVRVPLIILPPTGTPGTPGRTVDVLAQNNDLTPTFLELADHDLPRPVDGTSLVPLLHGADPPDTWRQAAFIEFTKKSYGRAAKAAQVSASYRAIRTESYLYVNYADGGAPPTAGEAEFYDLRADPGQIDNLFAELSEADQATLAAATARYAECRGEECADAGASAPSVTLPGST